MSITKKKQTKTTKSGTSTKSIKTTKSTNTTKSTKSTSKKRPTYKKSNSVKKAEKRLEDWEKSAPGEYKSKYSPQIDGILDEILNREKFSYNLNADPLYQQYRESYTQNGKKAMMDTVGQASAMTGGYANSYAVTAGNQAYHEYLNELNDVALDLRDRAYEQYGDEGDKLIEDITILRSLDGDEYDRYLDGVERYYKDGEYLLERLLAMSDAEYEQFLHVSEAWENDRDYAFKVEAEEQDKKEFDREMEFKESEAKRDQANKDRDYELSRQRAYSSGGSGGSSGSGSKKKKASQTISYPETYKEFCSATGYPGIMTETEFFAHSNAKKKYGTYKDYLKAMYKIYK